MSQLEIFRKRSGLTQSDVSNALGLKHKSAVSKWETGGSLPRADMLPKIAALYNCTVDDLLGEGGEDV